MEGQSSVEVGRQAGADAGETGVCHANKQKQQYLQQQQRWQNCLVKEIEYQNDDDDDDDTNPEEMTAGSGITNNHRAASVSPQDCSMNRKVSE